jgi:hypothetical protein
MGEEGDVRSNKSGEQALGQSDHVELYISLN